MNNVPREIDNLLEGVRRFIFTNKNTKEYVNYILANEKMPIEFENEIENNILEKCGNSNFIKICSGIDIHLNIYVRISVWEGDFGMSIQMRELTDFIDICRR